MVSMRLSSHVNLSDDEEDAPVKPEVASSPEPESDDEEKVDSS